MNLISIIEESEKEFDEKRLKQACHCEDCYQVIKSHNRQTILKLVEGIEEEINKANISKDKVGSFKDGYDCFKKQTVFLLQSLKDKLK